MDIFSRYVVGWMIAERESEVLAQKLIKQTCINQQIEPNQLYLHANRGASMKSKAVAQLLIDLKVEKSHSRPHTSNDNPYSEAQFKTLKYHVDFPDRFNNMDEAKLFCQKSLSGITTNTSTLVLPCFRLMMFIIIKQM